MTIRSRFAPSPTGYLHIGGARTALYAWAFARRYGGTFILRIEDTDVERSTPEAVQAILDGMQWLGLTPDEGPFYQMRRMARYKEAIDTMLAAGSAYHCYMSAAELDRLREAQRARGDKPRYDGTWRPEPGKILPPIPADVQPVVRFRNPEGGMVAWVDAVKGRIEIANMELDDLVIARADGTPTYNFCVCVDDWDMKITHVIRGDDHVNNTPRQINILQALGAEVPVYAHLSMILGDDGQKLSKRHGAVSVMEYPANGYVRDAVLNYLARLGWSHGDDEVFSMAQFCEWFDLDHITPSAAQFNTEKLNWLNQEYLKKMDGEALGAALAPFLLQAGLDVTHGPPVAKVAELLRDRAPTLVEMAAQAHYFYQRPMIDLALLAQHLVAPATPAIRSLAEQLKSISWSKADISVAIKAEVSQAGLKMPQLMMPLRVLLTGQTQTPGVDAVIDVLGRDEVIARLAANLP
ncbi:glutamyl-tRNA synthetase [Betaproteobacteria bacterium UKL13-2]|jgi:glutamyl-tRNA synthetase|nr:glutamyl-tRNA synthetase [Betaproteobacteria bacterium UKL13-2]HCG53701.1 glutamate--tRNA ligase [Betaproteobacteria bacterium]